METAMADDFAIRTGVPVEDGHLLCAQPHQKRPLVKSRPTGADISRTLRRRDTHDEGRELIPSKGERIELLRPRLGIRVRGTVFYADQLQILVKWDDGRSESLRPGVDRFRIVAGE
jgi:hypothetical protein